MTLIGVLLALACERAFGHLPGVGEPMLFRRYLQLLRRALPVPAFWRSWAAPVLIVVPIVALTGWIQYRLEHPVLELVFSIVVLFLCLGPRDLSDDISRLLHARETGDEKTARELSRALMQSAMPESKRDELVGALFIQSHERLFGALLWFFALGPAGAIAYRLSSRLPRLLREAEPDAVSEQASIALHTAMAWVPARVTAALYGMAGSMDDAMQEWRRVHDESELTWRNRTWALLAEVPTGSLSIEEAHSGPAAPASLNECLREVQALQMRALLILLAIFAVFTVGELV